MSKAIINKDEVILLICRQDVKFGNLEGWRETHIENSEGNPMTMKQVLEAISGYEFFESIVAFNSKELTSRDITIEVAWAVIDRDDEGGEWEPFEPAFREIFTNNTQVA